MSQAATEAPSAHLTRQDAVKFLNENGFPITFKTFERISMPSRGKGPRVDYVFNGRLLYRPEDLLAWARARAQPYTRAA